MRIIARDVNMASIAEIDMYTSMIWTDRYSENGDFELQVPCTSEYYDLFEHQAKYLTIDKSDRVMVIEKRQIQTQVDNSDKYIITGRSAETLLDRRVIMGSMTFGTGPYNEQTNTTASQPYATGDFMIWYEEVCIVLKPIAQGEPIIKYDSRLHNEKVANIRTAREDEEIELSEQVEIILATLLNENVMNPTDPSRRFVNPKWRFIFSSDPRVQEIKMSASFNNVNLYDAVSSILVGSGLGCKVVYNDTTETFDFSVFRGIDRSVSQGENPVVNFKNVLDNLVSTDFATNEEKYKTCAYVVGAVDEKKTLSIALADEFGQVSSYEYPNPNYCTTWCQQVSLNGTGISYQRREVIVDASDIDRYQTVNVAGGSTANDIPISETDYRAMLKTRGRNELMGMASTYDLDAEILPDMFYQYMVDYNLGDTISIEDRFGNTINASVTELIFSLDGNGYKAYPTIETIGVVDGMDQLVGIFINNQIYVDANKKMIIPDIREKLRDLRSKTFIAFYVADIIDYFLDNRLIYANTTAGDSADIIVPRWDDMDMVVFGGNIAEIYENPGKFNNISTRAIQFVQYMMNHQISGSVADIYIPSIDDLSSYIQ